MLKTISVNTERESDPKRWLMLLLVLSYMLNFVDRSILNTVGQAIRQDLGLTDFQLGLLGGAAFGLMNAAAAIPLAALADKYSKVWVLSISLACWSAFTVACGFAQNVWNLALCRIGVGIAEAGGNPPAQALISDYYPPRQRASAMGIYVLGVPIGIVVGSISSGWITVHFGWRAALMAVGLPGLILAVLIRLTVKERRRDLSSPVEFGGARPTVSEVFRQLWSCRSCVHLIAGSTVISLGNYGIWQFLHPFFVRALGLSYFDAALEFAAITGAATALGSVSGGLIADRLAKLDQRIYLWLPGVGTILAAPVYMVGFSLKSPLLAGVTLVLAGMLVQMYYGPTYATIHRLVNPRGRSVATALSVLTTSLIGLTLGPSLVGYLSDHFSLSAMHGISVDTCRTAPQSVPCVVASAVGVRKALLSFSPVYCWASLHYFLGAKHLLNDLATNKFGESQLD
jgi:predicted MFS family arabinose efflux permease